MQTIKLRNPELKSKQIVKSLQYPSGLFGASKKSVSTGYDKAWIRDNIYESLALEATGETKALLKAYRALFDILLKHESKIDHAITQKPKHSYQYIHARFNPKTFDEFSEEWGNKQNDAIGAFLFKVGDLDKKCFKVIRNLDDIRILQKLVMYLQSIEYWHDEDNGMWEENTEVHASSVGACVAGLKAISHKIIVPPSLIKKGEDALKKLLPNESATKKVDMALLSLIYPYDIVDSEMKLKILHNVEKHLVRKRGVLRYIGDQYYNQDGEAEWTMGFPWLAKIYKELGFRAKCEHYMNKTYEAMNEKGELPELYFSNSDEHNENSPLGWAQSMFLVALK
ncbi:MAG: glycoside hydrolase family 15 [Nanoarchaeota archaeon]|nr:MAG: glycoside hydrolase family 15 [Nanoarchaeota archaeon]